MTMNTLLRMSLRCLPASLLATSVLHAALLQTDWSEYSVGAVQNDVNGWVNAGWDSETGQPTVNNVYWIAQSNSTNPQAPGGSSNLSAHPVSPSGGNLLWVSARTHSKTSGSAFLRLVDTGSITEPFKVSFDLFISPNNGTASGNGLVLSLMNGTSTVPTTNPQIRFNAFSNADGGDVRLDVRNKGTWETGTTHGYELLPAAQWLRFELTVNEVGSNGSWGIAVYQLDETGSVTGSLLSESGIGLNHPQFTHLKLQVAGSRRDYWIDNISVTPIPEPASTGLLIGLSGAAGLLLTRRRR